MAVERAVMLQFPDRRQRRERLHAHAGKLPIVKEVEAVARFGGKLLVEAIKTPVVQVTVGLGADAAVSIADGCPVTPNGMLVRTAVGLGWLVVVNLRR